MTSVNLQHTAATEDAQRSGVEELALSILNDAESFLQFVMNKDNSLAAIKEFSEALIDNVFALEITLEPEGDDDFNLDDEVQ